jgi:hypothetical protein
LKTALVEKPEDLRAKGSRKQETPCRPIDRRM